jgi:hypothetical protein
MEKIKAPAYTRKRPGFQHDQENADYKSDTVACTCSNPTSAAIFSSFDRVSGCRSFLFNRRRAVVVCLPPWPPLN